MRFDAIKVFNGAVEALADPVALRTLDFCPGVFHVFDGEVKFVFMVFCFAAVFRSAIGEYAK